MGLSLRLSALRDSLFWRRKATISAQRRKVRKSRKEKQDLARLSTSILPPRNNLLLGGLRLISSRLLTVGLVFRRLRPARKLPIFSFRNLLADCLPRLRCAPKAMEWASACIWDERSLRSGRHLPGIQVRLRRHIQEWDLTAKRAFDVSPRNPACAHIVTLPGACLQDVVVGVRIESRAKTGWTPARKLFRALNRRAINSRRHHSCE